MCIPGRCITIRAPALSTHTCHRNLRDLVSELTSTARTAMESALGNTFFQPPRPRSDLLCPPCCVFAASTCCKHVALSQSRPARSRVAGGRSSHKRTRNERLVVMNHFASYGSRSCFTRYHHHTIPFARTGLSGLPELWLLTTEASSLRSLALGYPTNWIPICLSPLP